MRKIKEIKNKLYLTFSYIIILVIFWILQVPCFFKHFLGFECIGCGMTRAILCALKLDFRAAFAYHPMFWSMPLLYLYFLFDGSVIGKKIPDILVLSMIALGFVLHWLLKIF